MADWTITVNITVTLTLKKGKGKCFDSGVCLNFILKWAMTFDSSVAVSVKTVILFSWMIFSFAGDRLAQKCLRVYSCRIM